ncbi:ATP-grasp domain-containing protein [Stenotrophomonas nitritireducens]|uniref:ATP-grasp domain-containing protein n=1 Tax=Stenotrophomonas nitritireducens TaxID=83617 RepID=UPI003D95EA48
MMVNVLVFPCGSEIGLEIHAALRHAKDICLHGASSVSDHGEFVYARYRQIPALAGSAELVSQLNMLIDAWNIDLVVPAHDSVIPVLADNRQRLRAPAMVPDAATAAICRNKNRTYEKLQGLGIVPRRAEPDATGYPIFAKPAVGQGSQGAERVDDIARHRQLAASGIEYVFSEYLPGTEYTVDCISSSSGDLLHAAARVRGRVKSGISVRTEPAASDPALQAMAEAIASELRLKGAWFFQARRDREGMPKLLEVAPRIAGSMALNRMRGINYPLLSVYAHLGMSFTVMPQHYPLVMDRALGNRWRADIAYERVYLDLDDTLLVRGAPEPLVVALLYQWNARGIPVVLITRHAAEPEQTLARHRICTALFERIVHVRDGSPKSTAIPPGEAAIFIDDAFSERAEVAAARGIPVFDVDALEQLRETRA